MSLHFSDAEMIRSQSALRLGLPNEPHPWQWANLNRLRDTLLEPVRELLGVPLAVNSGFRSAAVNAHVGGHRNSAHLYGRAADLSPIGMSVTEAIGRIAAVVDTLPIDQAIEECGPSGWLHLSIPADGAEPRRELLTATGSPGAWVYRPWPG